ncbi:unnamed protein product [Auanema sp. JU1783]|nr:unnamed protein product [Auanema sp. JU1783]
MSLTLMSIITYYPKPTEYQPTRSIRISGSDFKSHDKPISSRIDRNFTEVDDKIMFKAIRPRTAYEPRKDMGACAHTFGKVLFFVAYIKESMETHYRVAQESLRCYLRGTDYEVAMVDIMNDPRVVESCSQHSNVFFRKHCAAAVYLNDTDWLVVLDADTGIANPNHCIEEWIDDRVDILFYERIFNFEIASGNYIIKNSEFSRNFLKKWSDFEHNLPSNWNGADNGALQILILQMAIPDAFQEYDNCNQIWHEGQNYETYMNYVTCVKLALGANRLWPEKLRIYRRAHGWVRDGFMTTDKFCEVDFMFHGWKNQLVGQEGWESPFNKNLNPEMCGEGDVGWDWRKGKRTTCDVIKKEIADFEKSAGQGYPKAAREIPHLRLPDVGICFPNCDKFT